MGGSFQGALLVASIFRRSGSVFGTLKLTMSQRSGSSQGVALPKGRCDHVGAFLPVPCSADYTFINK